MSCRNANGNSENGSALVYILIAIALLAALTVAFMEPSSTQNESQGTFRTVSKISSQADFLRAVIQECILAHSRGDRGAIVSADQKNNPYPLMPDSGYFNAQCGAGESAGDSLARYLRCPGNPGDNPCHAKIFSGGGSSGFLPQPPNLFGEWRYYNGDDGVFIWIQTDKTDAFLENAIDKLDAENYAKCEADKIVPSGSDFVMTTDEASVKCTNGGKCFRVWLKIKDGASPIYQEAGCP